MAMLYRLSSTPPPSPVPRGPTDVERNRSFKVLGVVFNVGFFNAEVRRGKRRGTREGLLGDFCFFYG